MTMMKDNPQTLGHSLLDALNYIERNAIESDAKITVAALLDQLTWKVTTCSEVNCFDDAGDDGKCSWHATGIRL